MSDERESKFPESWLKPSLEQFCEIIQGQSPPGDTYNSEGKGLPFFQGKAEFGELYPQAVKWCTEPSKIAKRDDVLISIRAPVGPTNLSPSDACIGRGLAAIRPEGGIHPKYVLYGLRSNVRSLVTKGTGSTFEAISGNALRAHALPLAPLNEQRRIVAEIEKQFARLDEGVTALKRTAADLRLYRASVLKSACEGHLVLTEATLTHREKRDYEPASVLLQRILKQRRARWERDELAKMKARGKRPKDSKWKERYVEPAEPSVSHLPELPEGWRWVSLEQLSDETRSITYGVVKLGEHIESGVPTLRSSNVRHLSLDLNGVKRISPVIAKNYQRTFLKGGEVLLTVRGTLGGVVSVPKACAGYNISREVAMIALVEDRMSKALAVMISSPQIQNWLLDSARGLAYTGINIETLKVLPIPLPPLAEQKRIVAEVEKRLRAVEGMEATVALNLARAEELRRAILQRAFAGRLIPPDPADEPASRLLERIAAERLRREEAMKKKKRKPRRPSRAEKMPGLFQTEPKEIRRALLREGRALSIEEAFEEGGFSYTPDESGEFTDVDAFFEQLSALLTRNEVELQRRPDEVLMISHVLRRPPVRPRTRR